MEQVIAAFPHVSVGFNRDGGRVQTDAEESALATLAQTRPLNLFVFAHGWHTAREKAEQRYAQFFQLMHTLLEREATAAQDFGIATLGVHWPSRDITDVPRRWAAPGGAAYLNPSGPAGIPEDDIGQLFPDSANQHAVEELTLLMSDPLVSRQNGALKRVQFLLGQLAQEGGDATADEEAALSVTRGDPKSTFESLGEQALADAALGINAGDPAQATAAFHAHMVTDRVKLGIWSSLDHLSFWLNKQRAGIVGEKGLGPLLGTLCEQAPNLRMHLLGHSFGARLVSFSLRGLPPLAVGSKPVKSLLLLQGAFSHSAFAAQIATDDPRPGALAGVADAVDGPLIATFSNHDTALGGGYPFVARLRNDDRANIQQNIANFVRQYNRRWGAVGSIGFVNPPGETCSILTLGNRFVLDPAIDLRRATFVSVDCNKLIKSRPKQDAHGDIMHPQLAWLALLAAGLIHT